MLAHFNGVILGLAFTRAARWIIQSEFLSPVVPQYAHLRTPPFLSFGRNAD
jgi:hypothetical protein